ncbi:MAG: zinc-ribbon domain-containing protein [Deltaproteobacteria bacterium]|nr:zinc-ribbon domain-containing protein [Deltaproteobacteria bacterium]
MIVTCPECQARYKVDEAKIKGRGAKISCPKCQHVFVVYKDASGGEGADAGDGPIADRDFHQVGVTWLVRRGMGLVDEFSDLAWLMDQLEEGEVDLRDAISFDAGRSWTLLSAVADLEAFFEDVWERAQRGEIDASPVDDTGGDEDDDDAPTTIVNRNAELADAIRRAVQESGSTPAPAPVSPPPAAPAVEPPVAPAQDTPAEPAAPVQPEPPAKASGEHAPATPAASSAPRAPAAATPPAPAPGGGKTGLIIGVVLVLVVVLAVVAAVMSGAFAS